MFMSTPRRLAWSRSTTSVTWAAPRPSRASMAVSSGNARSAADHLRVPQAQCRQVAALQDVGILRTGLVTPAAKLQVLVSHQEQPPARHQGHVLAQALDHRLGGDLAFADGFEANQHHRVVGAAVAADETGHAEHRRVLQHGLAEDFHLRLHHAERQPVIAAHKADQLPGVLLGMKVFGTTTYSAMFTPTVISRLSKVRRRWRSTQSRLVA